MTFEHLGWMANRSLSKTVYRVKGYVLLMPFVPMPIGKPAGSPRLLPFLAQREERWCYR